MTSKHLICLIPSLSLSFLQPCCSQLLGGKSPWNLTKGEDPQPCPVVEPLYTPTAVLKVIPGLTPGFSKERHLTG